MKYLTPLAVAITLALTAPALADTLNVPSDDYPTVQSAVSAAAEGDVIRIKGGPFLENVVRGDMPADVTIQGKGKPVIDAGGNGHGLDLAGGSGLVITGIVVSNADGHGMRVANCAGLVITRCAVSGATQDGIFANDCAGALISRNIVEDVQSTGIRTHFFVSSAQAEISRNRLERCGQWAIQIQGADGAAIDRNRVSDGGGGIAAAFLLSILTRDVQVSRNLIQDLTGVGILLDADESTADRNGLRRVAGAGIQVLGDDCFVTRNVVLDNGTGSGIHNTGLDNEFSRNKIIRCGGRGVHEEGSGTHYDRNAVVRAGAHGFELDPFGDGSYFRNKVIRSGEDGFRVNQGANTFERNVVVRAGDDGFQILASGGTFTSNRVTRADSRGFQIETWSNTFEGNSATRCTTGFDVRHDGNTFTGNKASGNSENDLHDRIGVGANDYSGGNKFRRETFDQP